MMYSTTLLASLLALAHGFGSIPPGSKPVCAPTAKYDPYDLLPSVPSFELTSENITHGATTRSRCGLACHLLAAAPASGPPTTLLRRARPSHPASGLEGWKEPTEVTDPTCLTIQAPSCLRRSAPPS